METESFVGQVGRLLVLGFAVGSLEGDAMVLAQIPDQIAPDRAVVGPTECRKADGRDVVVVGIVDPDTGVTVQVWPQVEPIPRPSRPWSGSAPRSRHRVFGGCLHCSCQVPAQCTRHP